MQKFEYDAFDNYHPLVNFVYFTSILLFSMFFMHPVFQVISFIAAISYMLILRGGKDTLIFNFKFVIPVLILMSAINPLINHAGVTILFYLESGNPVTKESIIYGIAAALMLVTVIIWFTSYNSVMTSDKVMHLFGGIIPSLSLIFSMILRFVPRYLEKIKEISMTQKSLGMDASQGNIIVRAKNGIKILSIMMTWALENSIETADSMRSRGYGLGRRTSFSNFKFYQRDIYLISIILSLVCIVFLGAYYKVNTIKFFPAIKINKISIFSLLVYFAYLILCMLPVIINIQEDLRWKYIESKI